MTEAQADCGHELANIVSELQEYFDHCDHDDDGRIQYEEFLRLLGYLRARLSNPDSERWFRRMDNDHDGFIDIRQFVAGWME
jgi:Ca2+-binding EF-hand superfamily protein